MLQVRTVLFAPNTVLELCLKTESAQNNLFTENNANIPCRRLGQLPYFSSRESHFALSQAIAAILDASSGIRSTLDVIVNGNNRALAETIKREQDAILENYGSSAQLRIWHIVLGDKANAWNRYIYEILPGSQLTFFVDGYVEVAPNAFKAIEAALGESDHYLAATGVLTVGRSAERLRERMLREGGIHGNLYACHMILYVQFVIPLSDYHLGYTVRIRRSAPLWPSIWEL